MILLLTVCMILLVGSIVSTLYVWSKYGKNGWEFITGHAILPSFLLGIGIAALSAIEYSLIMRDREGPFLGINPFMFLFLNLITYLIAMIYYMRKYKTSMRDFDE